MHDMAFGRLERSPGPQPMSEINMTPLVDVMLVLVVILIITAPLMVRSLRVDLPRAAAATAAHAVQHVSLVLDRAGRVTLDGQPQDAPSLARALQQAAQANPETEVQLRADAAVPYGRVVEVMGAAHQAGLHRVGFVTEPDRRPGN